MSFNNPQLKRALKQRDMLKIVAEKNRMVEEVQGLETKIALLHACKLSLAAGESQWMRKLREDRQKRELVAGGNIIWKPIDLTARRVIAPAPWWSKLQGQTNDETRNPQSTSSSRSIPLPDPQRTLRSLQAKSLPNNHKQFRQRHLGTTERNAMSQSSKLMNGDSKFVGNSDVIQNKPNDVLNAELAGDVIKRTDRALDKTQDLVDRAMDARAALDMMCSTWKVDWLNFCDDGEKRLIELRQTRMAFDTETRQLMSQLREVRQFFLDKDYETERTRLREFVELCERLQKLKESGFLDTVADTLLKLTP